MLPVTWIDELLLLEVDLIVEWTAVDHRGDDLLSLTVRRTKVTQWKKTLLVCIYVVFSDVM